MLCKIIYSRYAVKYLIRNQKNCFTFDIFLFLLICTFIYALLTTTELFICWSYIEVKFHYIYWTMCALNWKKIYPVTH